MANLMHMLFKNSSLLRIITVVKTPQLLESTPTLIPYVNNPTLPLFNPKVAGNVSQPTSTHPLQLIYPNFPFGCCLKPISSPRLDQSKEADSDHNNDDARTVWADSVKKKRKKKMNKHKYKKLRKRLRRKT